MIEKAIFSIFFFVIFGLLVTIGVSVPWLSLKILSFVASTLPILAIYDIVKE
jgi:hypothetical protein